MRKSNGIGVNNGFYGLRLHKERQYCTISNSRWRTGGTKIEQQDTTKRAGGSSNTTKNTQGSTLCNPLWCIYCSRCFLCSLLHPSCSIFPSIVHSLYFLSRGRGKAPHICNQSAAPVWFLPLLSSQRILNVFISPALSCKKSAPTKKRDLRKAKLHCPLLCFCLLHYPMGWGFPVAYMISGTLHVARLRCMFSLVNQSTIREDEKEKNVVKQKG